MTAERLLANLWDRGAVVSFSGDRLRVQAPRGLLTPSLHEALTTHKADLRGLVRFVAEYQSLFHTNLDDASFVDAQARLIDELGPVLATAVCRAVERQRAKQAEAPERSAGPSPRQPRPTP